jgi:putative addiction module component (TIGR02574 family)
MNARLIEQEALRLSVAERAKLAHRLLESLDELTEAEAEKLWSSEIERRLHEIDEGKVRLVEADELERRVRARLR